MHATAEVLQKCLPEVMGPMHATLAAALSKMVQALIVSRRLILMDLARACPGAQHVRAPLKCFDRLLSNPTLWAQREVFYAQIARWVVRQSQPIILVDWSDLHEDGRHHLLRAAVALQGRSFTVLEKVFPESLKNSPTAHKEFLESLRAVLPLHVRPILVTDAGFQAPWFQAVARMGWHYVGRLRHRTLVQLQGAPWRTKRHLHAQATPRARRFSSVKVSRANPWYVDLVLYKRRPRGRVSLTHRGRRSRSRASEKAEKSEREPWLLAVSCDLNRLSARQIVKIYSLRMQIEQSFRDLKCERFGCAFFYSLTRKPQRIAMLLLIHALASLVTWLAVLSDESQQSLRHYGGIVSSRRPRPHYSTFRVSWEALRHADPRCTSAALWHAFKHPPDWFIDALQVPSG